MPAPSKVNFPGQKQRIRMRGTKQASKDVKQRLKKNLAELRESPESLLPVYNGPKRIKWGRKSPVYSTLGEINKIIDNRFDRKWLSKRTMSKRGDTVAKAWAGAMLAAQEEDYSTVSVFKHPLYGSASYIRKGDSRAGFLTGVQNHHNPRLRLLPWEEHAKKGWWFFSSKNGFICSGQKPVVNNDWILGIIERTKINFISQSENLIISSDLNPEAIGNNEFLNDGYFKLNFSNGTTFVISEDILLKELKEPLVMHFALGALPPKLTDFTEVEFIWAPEGWEGELPQKSLETVEEIMAGWLNLMVQEKFLPKLCRKAILDGLEEGFILGEKWFKLDDYKKFIMELSGNDLERLAVEKLFEMIPDKGFYVNLEGEIEWKEESKLIWLESESIHLLLVSMWEEYGLELLNELFDIKEQNAQEIHAKQLKKREAFGNFLRKLNKTNSIQKTLSKFPWQDIEFEGPCGVAHALVMLARSESVGVSCAYATKIRGSLEEEAIAWSWLLIHKKHSGKDWKFNPPARDLGGDWSVSLKNLWEESANVGEEGPEGYISKMNELQKTTGTQHKLPN
ncbi:MAG: hypothetical protein CMB48_03845 [Euryarchaeota archaeon]|nr:hypothetical protein [Euryarchaeota archaeon]|tara:strand:+ start:5898 stop:7595 length:1698 start_codon:yes stop_codon:yes gene_type:complete